MAIRKKLAETLLKGSKVHWKRSCRHVAEKVSTSRDETRERDIFMKISSWIQTVDSAVTIVACFESLCGIRSVSQLLKDLPGLCSTDNAKFMMTTVIGQLQNTGVSGGQGVIVCYQEHFLKWMKQ